MICLCTFSCISVVIYMLVIEIHVHVQNIIVGFLANASDNNTLVSLTERQHANKSLTSNIVTPTVSLYCHGQFLNIKWKNIFLHPCFQTTKNEKFCCVNILRYEHFDRSFEEQISNTFSRPQRPVNKPLVGDKILSEPRRSQFIEVDMHHLWPLLLTWINFNPSMDKYLHPL